MDDLKEQSKKLRDYKMGVNSANAAENKVNKLETQQKKHDQELNKIFRANSKLYKTNESEERQQQAQKFAEFGKYAERDTIGGVDPYDNTPSGKKRGTSALSYATTAHTNNLLEKILKVQDNSAFNQSLLNLQQQQVSLLGVISENLKTLRGVMEPKVSSTNQNNNQSYEHGITDIAKQLASGQFDKAMASYGKAMLGKMDTTGNIGMSLATVSMMKDMLGNGGLYNIINQSIRSTVKETIFGKDITSKIDAFVEDAPKFIQGELNKLATSNNKAIRNLIEPAFKLNKIDLERKQEKKDWDSTAKFDNKFYFTVTDIIPKALREIVGAVKGTEVKQYDFDAQTYLTESALALKDAYNNQDKLANLLSKTTNDLGRVFEKIATLDPKMSSSISNILTLENGRAKKDINNNVIFKNKDVLSIIQAMFASGISVDQIGSNNDILIKHMGLDINKPENQAKARMINSVMSLLRDAYNRGDSDLKDSLISISDSFKDMHGKNTYVQNDGRLDPDIYEMANVLIKNNVQDPNLIQKYKNYADSSSIGKGFNGVNFNISNIKNKGPRPDPRLQAMRGYVDFNNMTAASLQDYIDIYHDELLKKDKYAKANKDAETLLKGGDLRTSTYAKIPSFDKLSNLSKAEEIWKMQQKYNSFSVEELINKDDYDIITGRTKSSDEDKQRVSEKVQAQHKRLEEALALFNVIHRSGNTAGAMAAIYNKPESFFINEGYIASPMDLFKIMNPDGTIDVTKSRSFGWSFISDEFIKKEKARQAEEDRQNSFNDGNAAQNVNKLIATVWNDPTLQKKLQIGSGSAAGLAIGAMLKNKGLLKSNFGVYAMGAIGAAVMQSERAKNMMDLMYGPDSGKAGASGFNNRDILMAKMANKLLPAAAAASTAGATFKFSQRIFNSLGPMSGLIGLIPSSMAALAVGGITYKMMPKLKEKIQNATDGKGMWGKIKEFAKENKTLSLLFGLTGQRTNARIYAESLNSVIQELKIKESKLRESGDLSSAEIMNRQVEELTSIQKDLIAIDKDENLPDEEKTSRASKLYDRMNGIITDSNIKQNLEFKIKHDIIDRDQAKAGIDAANINYTDFAKERARSNITAYNNATTINAGNINKLVESSYSKDEHVQRNISRRVAKMSGGKVNDLNTFTNVVNSVSDIRYGDVNARAQGISNLINRDTVKDSIYSRANDILSNGGVERFNTRYGTNVKTTEEAKSYIKDNIDTLTNNEISNKVKSMNDKDVTELIRSQFGDEMARLMSDDTFLEDSKINAVALSDDHLNSVGGKDFKNKLAQESIEQERDALYAQASKLGYSKEDADAFVLGELLRRNIESGNIKLDPERLRKQLVRKDPKSENPLKVFEFMDGTSDRTGIDELDQMLSKLPVITTDKTSKSGFATRQLVGNWLLNQIYMAKLGPNATPEDYNNGFNTILSDYIKTINHIKVKNNKFMLNRMTNGANSITEHYSLNTVVSQIKSIMNDNSIPEDQKTDIINSILLSQIESGRISPDDIYDIIGSQYYLENEFNKLVSLRSAIVKDSNGNMIPMDDHRNYIKAQIERLEPKSALTGALSGVASRIFGKFTGYSYDDKMEDQSNDTFLIKALTNLYSKPYLYNTPVYRNDIINTGKDGSNQYGWITNNKTWGETPLFQGENGLIFMNPDKLYNHVASQYGAPDIRSDFMRYAGMGIESDTINANKHAATKEIIKMSDLSGYKFINGMNLDSVGCSIAALNNALVKLGIPTLSKETMIDIANKYINNGGIHVNFFIDICNRLGISSMIYKGDTNNFNKEFFNKLQFGNTTYIALLDNLHSISGAHYVNILDIHGDNVTINDPNQSGINELSISEFTARCSVIIKISKESVTTPVKGIDVTIDKRNINYTGTGMNPFLMSTVPMDDSPSFTMPNFMHNFINKFSSNASKPETEQDGRFDPEVAQLATMVSDEKQARTILSFMSSSKNKAFAAAAAKFRSLMSKPDVRAELKEKQAVADSESQQGKHLAEINENIKKGKFGGGSSGLLSEETLAKLGTSGKKGTGLFSLLYGGWQAYKFGKNWLSKRAARKAGQEVLEEGAENVGSNVVKTTTKEVLDEGIETAAKESTENVINKTISTTIAETTEAGVKTSLKGASRFAKINAVGNSMDKMLINFVSKIVIGIPKWIAKVVANSSIIRTICKWVGTNPDDIIQSISSFAVKMMSKFKSFVNNGWIGKALAKAKSKVGDALPSVISGAIEVGSFLWAIYKGMTSPAKKLNEPGVTDQHIKQVGATFRIGLLWGWFDAGLAFVVGGLSTLAGMFGANVPGFIQIAASILLQMWFQNKYKNDFGVFVAEVDKNTYDAIMTAAHGDFKLSNQAKMFDSKIAKDAEIDANKTLENDSLGKEANIQQTESQLAASAAKETVDKPVNNLADKGGNLDPVKSSSITEHKAHVEQQRQLAEKTDTWLGKLLNKFKTNTNNAKTKIDGMAGATAMARTSVRHSFNFDNIPTPDALKDAKFTSNKTNNERAKKFMAMLLPIAKEMRDKGYFVDPYLAMTQWALESGWGARDSGNFNYWGIKASNNKKNYGPFWDGMAADVNTHEVINGKNLSMKDAFRAYTSPEQGIRDYFWFTQHAFPDIATKGTAGLMSGKFGAYATGNNYLQLVNGIYGQFTRGMADIGFESKSLIDEFGSRNASYDAAMAGIIAGEPGGVAPSSISTSSKVKPNTAIQMKSILGGNFSYPLQNRKEISSVFGDRTDVALKWMSKNPGKKMSTFHQGVDFAAPTGDPILSIADGKVIRVGGNHNDLVIQHNDGSIATYLHNSKINVKAGQSIKKGEHIAAVGGYGPKGPNTFGAHLHLALQDRHGTHVDPFFELGLDPKDLRINNNSPENKRYLEKLNAAKSEERKNTQGSSGMDKGGDYNNKPITVKSPMIKEQPVKPDNSNTIMIEVLNDIRALMGSVVQLLGTDAIMSKDQLNTLRNMSKALNDKSKLNFNNAAKSSVFVN